MRDKKVVYVTNNYYPQKKSANKPGDRTKKGWAEKWGEENRTIDADDPFFG